MQRAVCCTQICKSRMSLTPPESLFNFNASLVTHNHCHGAWSLSMEGITAETCMEGCACFVCHFWGRWITVPAVLELWCCCLSSLLFVSCLGVLKSLRLDKSSPDGVGFVSWGRPKDSNICSDFNLLNCSNKNVYFIEHFFKWEKNTLWHLELLHQGPEGSCPFLAVLCVHIQRGAGVTAQGILVNWACCYASAL